MPLLQPQRRLLHKLHRLKLLHRRLLVSLMVADLLANSLGMAKPHLLSSKGTQLNSKGILRSSKDILLSSKGILRSNKDTRRNSRGMAAIPVKRLLQVTISKEVIPGNRDIRHRVATQDSRLLLVTQATAAEGVTTWAVQGEVDEGARFGGNSHIMHVGLSRMD